MVTEGINGPINYLQEEIQVQKLGRPTTLKPQSTTFMENLIKKKNNKLFHVGLQMYLARIFHEKGLTKR